MLQALKLNINDEHELLDIVDVNTPLTALEIGVQLESVLFQYIKGLNCLLLHDILYPLPLLFQYHPNLEHLELRLDTAESVNKLFTILQSNTTLKALRAKISEFGDILISCGPSLQNMLILNKTLESLAINPDADNFLNYLSFPNNWSLVQHQSTGVECTYSTT